MKHQEKYTVITGASSGIGKATAEAFAKRGKHLILIARNQERLEALKAELQAEHDEIAVEIRAVDLTISEKVHQVYEALRAFEIETWINNAGVGIFSEIAEQDIAETEQMIQLNVTAAIIFSMLFVKDYQAVAGTQLINVSSSTGYLIGANSVLYSATKFFVNTFSEGLAYEMKSKKAPLQVKVLAPSTTKTEFGNRATKTSDYNYQEKHPQFNTSEEIAAFLLALYDSEKTLGIVKRGTFEFELSSQQFEYTGDKGE